MKVNDRVLLINGKIGNIKQVGVFKGGSVGYMVKTDDNEIYIVGQRDIDKLKIRGDLLTGG